MKRRARFGYLVLACGMMAIGANRVSAQSAAITLDNFNTDEGHFNQGPGFSGSSVGFQKTTAEYGATPPPAGTNPNPGTAVRDTAEHFEGIGSEKIVLFDDLDATTLLPNGGTSRLRFLSGTGTIANNTTFATTAGDDGWIGLAVKTDAPGWTVQIWLEGTENNGAVPKTIINDNAWHIYDWNLDDNSGGADGWGSVSGIVAGDAPFNDGTYSIDSVLFRNTAMPVSSTLYMDYVVKTATGHVVAPGTGGVGSDFDGNGTVDGNDFVIWQKNQGGPGTQPTGDATGEGTVDGSDLAIWQSKFGGPPAVAAATAAPEPACAILAAVAALACLGLRRR